MPGIEAFCVATALALASIYLLMVSYIEKGRKTERERESSNEESGERERKRYKDREIKR